MNLVKVLPKRFVKGDKSDSEDGQEFRVRYNRIRKFYSYKKVKFFFENSHRLKTTVCHRINTGGNTITPISEGKGE